MTFETNLNLIQECINSKEMDLALDCVAELIKVSDSFSVEEQQQLQQCLSKINGHSKRVAGYLKDIEMRVILVPATNPSAYLDINTVVEKPCTTQWVIKSSQPSDDDIQAPQLQVQFSAVYKPLFEKHKLAVNCHYEFPEKSTTFVDAISQALKQKMHLDQNQIDAFLNQSPFEGEDIIAHCKIICRKFNVDIHFVEINTTMPGKEFMGHRLINKEKAQYVSAIKYNNENTIHLIKEKNNFGALRPTMRPEKRLKT